MEYKAQDYSKVYDWGITGLWYSNNYGAALTSYALYMSVKKLGYSCILLYPPDGTWGNPEWEKEDSISHKFITNNCIASFRPQNVIEMYEFNRLCNGFISGSDLLWGHGNNIEYNYAEYVYLGFVDENKRRVAYSTSIGYYDEEFVLSVKNYIVRNLSKFDSISLREKKAVKLFSDIWGLNAVHTADPVFLLNKDEYLSLVQKECGQQHCEKKPYIFSYILEADEYKESTKNEVSRRLEIPLYDIPDLYIAEKNRFEGFEKISIAKWLKTMNESEFVITDSYHGMCFAIIFHKPFIILTPRSHEERVRSLIEVTNTGERWLKENNQKIIEKLINYEPDWSDIDKRMTLFINISRKYLIKALSAERITKDVQLNKETYYSDIIRIIYSEMKPIKEKLNYLEPIFRQRIIDCQKVLVKQILMAKCNGKSVTIKGAGIHTVELLRLIRDELNIVCIADRETRNINCYNTVKDDEIELYDPDVIIISSYKYNKEMRSDIEMLYGTHYEIIDIYTELDKAGMHLECEFYCCY